MVNAVLANGVLGAQKGMAQMDHAAGKLASAAGNVAAANADLPEVTESLIELRLGEPQGKTAAAVIRTADEVMGTLIDIKT